MCGMLPNMVPGIVMVVGLILFWNSPYMPMSIYNTPVMVIVTYVVLFLPYTVHHSDKLMILSCRQEVFSGNYIYIFRKIILPLIIPGILAGWAMTFTISIRVSSIASRITSISRNVSNVYFCSI